MCHLKKCNNDRLSVDYWHIRHGNHWNNITQGQFSGKELRSMQGTLCDVIRTHIQPHPSPLESLHTVRKVSTVQAASQIKHFWLQKSEKPSGQTVKRLLVKT